MIAVPAESVMFRVRVNVSPLRQVISNRCAMSRFTDAIVLLFIAKLRNINYRL